MMIPCSSPSLRVSLGRFDSDTSFSKTEREEKKTYIAFLFIMMKNASHQHTSNGMGTPLSKISWLPQPFFLFAKYFSLLAACLPALLFPACLALAVY